MKIPVATALLIAILATGCRTILFFASAHHVLVSDQPELWGDYRPGQTFVLTNYVFLEKRQDWAKLPVLVAPADLVPVGQMEWISPQNLDDYENNPDEWPEVIGVLNAGTRLRVENLWKWWTQVGRWLWVSAEILDGPYAGTTVDIMDLSTSTGQLGELDLLGPDPKVLQPTQHREQ